MAKRLVDYLIIGGGVAGYSCARQLRAAGAQGSIAVVSRDPDPPYDRTACSKRYLQGQASREDTLLAPADWWQTQQVELLTRTSALSLDLGEREVKLSSKQSVGFGQLLLATGANVRRLRVDGSDLQGIHYLRALGNADGIRRDAEDADHLVMVGGSYIATEVAASLTELGKRCTLVMQEMVTLERGFGPQAGRFFQAVLEGKGIAVRAEDEVAAFEGADGRVTAVVTKNGARVPADVVVIGAGVIPDVTLAQRAGLELGPRGGVKTDASLRTSVPGVFAAGDMCEYASAVHDGALLRIEHWDVAERQGETVARAMLGDTAPHDVVPYFFSDLSDWASLEYVGPAHRWDEEIVRGTLTDGAFTIWYVDGGRIAAALCVGRSHDLDIARELIRDKVDVSAWRQELADPDYDLHSLHAADATPLERSRVRPDGDSAG
jgi:3-phenylpropionate/trans-cinnamate dioxygenase ferredoxin reductase subunit